VRVELELELELERGVGRVRRARGVVVVGGGEVRLGYFGCGKRDARDTERRAHVER
jgi:hypothetical protein